jgi:single-strand DNA-binding protein
MNKTILIGNLTRDPDVRTTNSGVTVTNFTIAVNRKFKDQNGDKHTDFFNIIAWRQLGELCGKYLFKGSKVAVSGELQNRSYEAKDGTKRTITEIVADDIEFLTPKDRANGYPQPATTPAQFEEQGFTDVEEELPFNRGL